MSGETMVSQSPVMMIVGERKSDVARHLCDNKTLQQHKVTRVGKECLRAEHQRDGGPAQIVIGHPLRLEHAARDAVDQEKT